jgi:hypothetical protein
LIPGFNESEPVESGAEEPATGELTSSHGTAPALDDKATE